GGLHRHQPKPSRCPAIVQGKNIHTGTLPPACRTSYDPPHVTTPRVIAEHSIRDIKESGEATTSDRGQRTRDIVLKATLKCNFLGRFPPVLPRRFLSSVSQKL